MENKYEYMLQVWGGFSNEDNDVPIKIKKLRGYHYFETKAELIKFKSLFEPYKKYGVAFDSEEGNLSHKRTIAAMDLLYQNKIYPIEYDFGYEYPEESAKFMFFDGNYSCDCNLSLIINEQIDEEFSELDCGNEIKIQNFKIIFRS